MLEFSRSEQYLNFMWYKAAFMSTKMLCSLQDMHYEILNKPPSVVLPLCG